MISVCCTDLVSADQKRKQVAKGVAEDKALKKAKLQFGDLGSSLKRYAQLTARSPAARRYYIGKTKPHRSYAPTPWDEFAAAEHEAGRYIDLLAPPFKHPIDRNDPNFAEKAKEVSVEQLKEAIDSQLEQSALRTFIPPTSFYIGVESWEKTVEFVFNTVRLLPHLMARVKRARTDATVVRLRNKEWRVALSDGYWVTVWMNEQRAQKVTRPLIAKKLKELEEKQKELELEEGEEGEELDMAAVLKEAKAVKMEFEKVNEEVFWKYGGEMIFGKEESDRIKSTPGAQLETGKLPCGCAVSKELLAKDPTLVHALLVWFNQLRAAHWLSDLVSGTLEKEGIAGGADERESHHTPDFTDALEVQKPIVAMIQRVVFFAQGVNKMGWPEGQVKTGSHAKWLEDFLDVLALADHAKAVDEFMATKVGRNWWTTEDVTGCDIVNTPPIQVRVAESQAFLRYWLTSFVAKQFPVEFTYQGLEGDLEGDMKCFDCREAAKDTGMAALFQEADSDYDDDDQSAPTNPYVPPVIDPYDLTDEESEREGFSSD